jgi:hypothetical protein
MEIKGMGTPKKVVIDGMNGLSGGAEFWTYVKAPGDCGAKYSNLTTLIMGPKDTYSFSARFFQDGTINEENVVAFYNNILESFHALK